MKPAALSPLILVWLLPSAVFAQTPATQAAIEAGDRIRVLVEDQRGEFTVVEVNDQILTLQSLGGPLKAEPQFSVRSFDELWVARLEDEAEARRSGARRGAGSGALAGFAGGVLLFLGSEYGPEAWLAGGVVLALPGALLGAGIGAARAQPQEFWEPVPDPEQWGWVPVR